MEKQSTVRWLTISIALALFLGGCASPSTRRQPVISGGKSTVAVPPSAAAPRHGGGYYEDDGPGDHPPADLDAIPDAAPRPLPLKKAANAPYTVLGRLYVPETRLQPFVERGLASWYGRKYNGKRTSSGEIYDMYAMTAAHPTLPIPSFARVTNLANHKSVIVKINDRGPFLGDRIIDLSYTAAHKLGIIRHGSAMVEVRSIVSSASRRAQNGDIPADAAEPLSLAQAPAVDRGGGIYLQLGAFSGRDNAENFRDKIAQRLKVLTHDLSIIALNGLFRVRAGPYPSISDARQAARRIKSGLDIMPLVVKP